MEKQGEVVFMMLANTHRLDLVSCERIQSSDPKTLVHAVFMEDLNPSRKIYSPVFHTSIDSENIEPIRALLHKQIDGILDAFVLLFDSDSIKEIPRNGNETTAG